MKPFTCAVGVALLLTMPAFAETTLHFSTKAGVDYAWELSWNNTSAQWQLSFVDDAIVVDGSNPNDAMLLNDYVLLPTTNISGISDNGDQLHATLNPREAFRIQSDTTGNTVLTATMPTGRFLAVGTNFAAYSSQTDDLDIGSFDAGYGIVIPALVNDEEMGLILDLSFSGDAVGGANMYDLLRGQKGVARGTLSGQITSIPEPATLLILGLGAAIANQFRSKRQRS